MKRTLGWNKRKLRLSQQELSTLINDEVLSLESTTCLKAEISTRKSKLLSIFKNRRIRKYGETSNVN